MLIKIFLIIILNFNRFVKLDCPPIHTIVNGQIVNTQFDPNCISKENSLTEEIAPTLIKCPQIVSIENGYVIGVCQTQPGSICKFGCMNGFQLSNTNPIACLSNGRWSINPLPVCENYLTNDCDINNLNRLFKNGNINCTYNENTRLVCKFACNSGFMLTGNPVLTCQSNNKFNTIPPTCVSTNTTNNLIEYNHSPITSPNLIYSKPFNYFVTSNAFQCQSISHLKSGSTSCDCPITNIVLGCTCRFFCNDNYYLVGAPMIQCTKNGSWSANLPVCRRGSSCPIPENLNRDVVLIHCETSINGRCFYRCKGVIYYIDSTGKIKSNVLNMNRFEIEDKSINGRANAKRSYDFTLKTNRCLRGNWQKEFSCEIEEELNSLNKLNITNGLSSTSSIYRRRRRRRRRRRPNRRRPFRRIIPIRITRPIAPLPGGRPRRRRRRRRRRPNRRPKNE